MEKFQYQNPTQIIFGEKQVAKITNLIPENANILMIYGGGSIKCNGAYDQVKEALKDFNVVEFGGIEANPQFSTLMKAVEVVREKNINFIVPVGGGSVYDGTKFIATAARFQGDPWQILRGAVIADAVPFGGVMTIPATGSEMNCGAVISRKETGEKYSFASPLVFPKFSVMDPAFTRTLPKIQRANGVVDTFVHVIEQYLTYDVNAPLQDRMAESIFLTLIELGNQYVDHPDDLETAGNIMWSATLGLNRLIACGVPQDWSTHMIGHELTAMFGIDHAQTLAIVLPGLMRVMRNEKKEKLLKYAQRVWNINGLNEEETIETAIERTEQFFNSLGIKTKFADYNLTKEDAEKIVEALETKGFAKLGEKGEVTPEKVREILLSRN